jgi:hypothetical protein
MDFADGGRFLPGHAIRAREAHAREAGPYAKGEAP